MRKSSFANARKLNRVNLDSNSGGSETRATKLAKTWNFCKTATEILKASDWKKGNLPILRWPVNWWWHLRVFYNSRGRVWSSKLRENLSNWWLCRNKVESKVGNRVRPVCFHTQTVAETKPLQLHIFNRVSCLLTGLQKFPETKNNTELYLQQGFFLILLCTDISRDKNQQDSLWLPPLHTVNPYLILNWFWDTFLEWKTIRWLGWRLQYCTRYDEGQRNWRMIPTDIFLRS